MALRAAVCGAAARGRGWGQPLIGPGDRRGVVGDLLRRARGVQCRAVGVEAGLGVA